MVVVDAVARLLPGVLGMSCPARKSLSVPAFWSIPIIPGRRCTMGLRCRRSCSPGIMRKCRWRLQESLRQTL